MNAELKLTKFLPAEGAIPPGAQHGWPLLIQAKGRDIPDEIFVYQVGQLQGSDPRGDLSAGDRFSCVASLSQMSDVPRFTGKTLQGGWAMPFYRTSQMRIVCQNPAEVERVWNMVQQYAQILLEHWNACWLLKGVDRVALTDQTATTIPITMTPPTLIQLDYRPAGTAEVDGDEQSISSPNSAMAGWLPVSSAPDAWIVPPGAVFYYNLEQDTQLQSVWPLPDPFSGHALHRNGILMPYGMTYVIDAHTIWWLAFDPDNLPGYQRLPGQPSDSAAPWPMDYVDPQNPGAVSPKLTLTVYGN